MFAGVDLGTTQTKIVLGPDVYDLHMHTDPFPHDAIVDPGMRELRIAGELVKMGCEHVGVMGSRSHIMMSVHMSEIRFLGCPHGADPVKYELELQTRGVRYLLSPHELGNEFLIVSIGTGTSFALVSNNGIRQYEPGLCVGSRTILQLAASRGIKPDRIDDLALKGEDPDLLMKHIYPHLTFPMSEFVLASMGRLGCGVDNTDENFCAGLMKMIAAPTLGHVLTIVQNIDWQWDGPIVFIGTPVAAFSCLRHWLLRYTQMLGRRALMPQQAAYAGAIGAYLHVQAFRQAELQP